MEPLALYLCAGFALAVGFGVVASIGNYCTMGALSDWVNMGESGRVRAWALALGVAVLGFASLDATGAIDATLLRSAQSAPNPYLLPRVPVWRIVGGGLLFGIGMTLAGGCSSKNLLRLGGGDGKALVALAALGAGAWSMVYTETGNAVLGWGAGGALDLAALGLHSQSPIDWLGASAGVRWGVALAIGGALMAWALSSAAFRRDHALLIAGVGVGSSVLGAWAVTAGEFGLAAVEASDFADLPTVDMGAQALSFTLPIGQAGYYLFSGLPAPWLSFGVCVCAGVVCGGLVHALLSGRFQWQWFHRGQGVLAHLLGGAMMGVGGVASMGCTVGQGLSGLSTLALGSALAVGAIAVGSLLTLRVALYRLLNEQAGLHRVLGAAVVDTFHLPGAWRPLDKAA